MEDHTDEDHAFPACLRVNTTIQYNRDIYIREKGARVLPPPPSNVIQNAIGQMSKPISGKKKTKTENRK